MNIKEYIEFFNAIPEDKWYGGGLAFDPNNGNKRCALAHLVWARIDDTKPLSKAVVDHCGQCIPFVNDGIGGTEIYGDTPKKRILEVLNQILLKQEAEQYETTNPAPEGVPYSVA